jgi:hypothetical protein
LFFKTIANTFALLFCNQIQHKSQFVVASNKWTKMTDQVARKLVLMEQDLERSEEKVELSER